MAWIDVAALRDRIRRMAQLACEEDGLEGAHVAVHVSPSVDARGRRSVTIQIDDHSSVDGTDPRWEPVRGRRWEDN